MRTATSIPRIYADERGLKHREITEQLIGIFFEIYNELGHGFLGRFRWFLQKTRSSLKDKLQFQSGSGEFRSESSARTYSWTGRF